MNVDRKNRFLSNVDNLQRRGARDTHHRNSSDDVKSNVDGSGRVVHTVAITRPFSSRHRIFTRSATKPRKRQR